MTIDVRQISENEKEIWDDLVFSSRQKSFLLTHDFLEMWRDSDPSLALLRFGCFDENGHLIGGQAIIHRKKLGTRLEYVIGVLYSSTPILREEVQDNVQTRHEILASLARISRKFFLYLRIEFDPSLIDTRPYLEQGWSAKPFYTHIWNITDPEVILNNLHRKRRYVRKAQEFLTFDRESGNDILDAFLALYFETMQKFKWKPNTQWCEAFKKQVAWLEKHDLFRLYTCRTQQGNLVGVVLYIIDKPKQTAFAWLTGYDHSFDCKEFPPAIYWYAANELRSVVRYIEFMEGNEVSIYAFKDSLGTVSKPFWVLQTPYRNRWIDLYFGTKRFFKKLGFFH
jgi:hypothetical protein